MMRAITVRQPFADAIVLGKKRVENRTKNLGAQPGEWIAIHAAKQHYAEGDGAFLRSDALRTQFWRHWAQLWPLYYQLPMGTVNARSRVLGAARVARVVPYHQVAHDPWAIAGHDHCIVFDRAVALTTPLQAQGALGLWTLPPVIEHALCAAIGRDNADRVGSLVEVT